MPEVKKKEEVETFRPTNKSSSLFTFFIQFGVVAAIFFTFGLFLGSSKFDLDKNGAAPRINFLNKTSSQSNADFSLFWDVYEKLPEKFLDKKEINAEKLLYGSIAGMVRSLGDPYTVFLDPKQNDEIKGELAGSYEGVGIQIGFNKDKSLVVIAPLSGSPAEKEGLKPKDLILKIDEKFTYDLTLPEAVDLIRGKAGSKVKLVLQREGSDSSYEKEIVREKIDVKSVELSYKEFGEKNIAIVKVSRFGEDTDFEWDRAVGEIASKNVNGVVVDMRNNPGGLLASSVHVASEFVSGTIVKQEYSDKSQDTLKADREGKLLKIPLVVLINGGSASASEIFAGAVQDNKRGKIVGEQSFGKGTVQDVVEFSNGAGLHVTIAKWLTPNGKSIHNVGIKPDVVLEDNSETEIDEQLDRAISML